MKLCFHVPKQTCKNQGASCLSACVLNRVSDLLLNCHVPSKGFSRALRCCTGCHPQKRREMLQNYKCTLLIWALLFGLLFNLILLNNNKKKSSFSVLANKSASATFLQNIAAQERHTVKMLLNSDSEKQGCIVHLFQSI